MNRSEAIQDRRTRASKDNLLNETVGCKILNSTFINGSARIWNLVPEAIKSSPSITLAKKNIKQWLSQVNKPTSPPSPKPLTKNCTFSPWSPASWASGFLQSVTPSYAPRLCSFSWHNAAALNSLGLFICSDFITFVFVSE